MKRNEGEQEENEKNGEEGDATWERRKKTECRWRKKEEEEEES